MQKSGGEIMAGNYAWRDCAGRTSDAIQFATQMGFVERKDGDWYLSLGEMLRFSAGATSRNATFEMVRPISMTKCGVATIIFQS